MRRLLLTLALIALPGLALAENWPVSASGDTTNTNVTLQQKGTGKLSLITIGAGAIQFFTTSTERWDIEAADGDLVPFATGNVDIGSAAKEVDNIYVQDLTVSATLGVTGVLTATGGIITGGNIVSDTDGNDSVGTAAVNFGDAYFGDGTDYVHIDEDQITSTTSFVVGTGVAAGNDLNLKLNGASSDLFVLQDDGATINFQITQAGAWKSSAGVTTVGLTDPAAANTACATTCVAANGACLFGQNTADMSIVDCADGDADVCICLGLTS